MGSCARFASLGQPRRLSPHALLCSPLDDAAALIDFLRVWRLQFAKVLPDARTYWVCTSIPILTEEAANYMATRNKSAKMKARQRKQSGHRSEKLREVRREGTRGSRHERHDPAREREAGRDDPGHGRGGDHVCCRRGGDPQRVGKTDRIAHADGHGAAGQAHRWPFPEDQGVCAAGGT